MVLCGDAAKGILDFPGRERWVVFAAPSGTLCVGLDKILHEGLAQK